MPRDLTCICEDCHTCRRRADERRKRRLQAYGRWQSPLVDAEPVRRHVLALRRSGVGQDVLAERAGISRGIIRALLYGNGNCEPSKKIRRENAHAILAVKPDASVWRPAFGVQRRLCALMAIGWTTFDLADRLGIGQARVSDYVTGRRTYVKRESFDKVARLYDEISMTPGPSQITRDRARRAGYAPPLAWDDDRIDDPRARPVTATTTDHYARLLPDDKAQLAAEVNRSGVTVVAEKYGSTPGAVNKALARAGYRAVTHGDRKQQPIYMKEQAA